MTVRKRTKKHIKNYIINRKKQKSKNIINKKPNRKSKKYSFRFIIETCKFIK